MEKTPEYLVIRIPLKAVDNGRISISSRSQKIIDEAISEGLEDIKAGRVFGPFNNIKEFQTVRKLSLREVRSLALRSGQAPQSPKNGVKSRLLRSLVRSQ